MQTWKSQSCRKLDYHWAGMPTGWRLAWTPQFGGGPGPGSCLSAQRMPTRVVTGGPTVPPRPSFPGLLLQRKAVTRGTERSPKPGLEQPSWWVQEQLVGLLQASGQGQKDPTVH